MTHLRNLFGLWYDPTSKKVYLDEEGLAPSVGANFTFEDHPGFNPLQYATEDTAKQVAEILRRNLPPTVTVAEVMSPYPLRSTTPRYWDIRVSQYGIYADLNAGLVANSLIRSAGASIKGILGELKGEGVLL